MPEEIINKSFRISVEYSVEKDTDNGSLLPFVSYRLFHPAHTYVPVAEGFIRENDHCKIEYKSIDGFRIHGRLFTVADTEEIALLGNLFYGHSRNQALQNHFDGTVTIFPRQIPHPDLPVEKGNPLLQDFPPELLKATPLFPYIAVLPWDKAKSLLYETGFLEYDAAASPAGSLYNCLVAASGDRMAMEQLVADFLENKTPFENQVYGSTDEIPFPFNRFPSLYDALEGAINPESFTVVLKEHFEIDEEQPLVFLPENDTDTRDRLWQNYFALTIDIGYDEQLLININKILLVCNLLDKPATWPATDQNIQWLIALLSASVVLSPPVFPLPPYTTVMLSQSAEQISPYAIGQLKMARYKLVRYQPGEISQIQNVLKGEKKKTTNRSYRNQSEQSSHYTTNQNKTVNNNEEVTQDLLTEVTKTLPQLTKKFTYDNFTTSYGPPTQTILNGSYTKTLTSTDPTTDKNGHFAAKVLNSTISRIQETVVKARMYNKYSEQEDTTFSLFNNQSGKTHFRGIYRWLNKVYRISVETYGYRFIMKLQVEKPAAEFIQSQQELNNLNFLKPLWPSGISGFDKITKDNYIEILSRFRITDIVLPPDEVFVASGSLYDGETEKIIPLPTGYTAVQATVVGKIAGNTDLTVIEGFLGKQYFSVTTANLTQVETIQLDNETGQVVLSVIGNGGTNTDTGTTPSAQNGFILNIEVSCQITERRLNEWKLSVYKLLAEAYEKAVEEYYSVLTRFAGDTLQSNPLLLNNIVKSALYNSCLSLLKNITANKTGAAVNPASITINPQKLSEFLEQAFEWDEMTYHFNDQPSRQSYALQGPDDSLRPFLQSASAGVYLPIHPRYNFSVLYYLSSGIVWQEDYPFIPVHEKDIALASQLKKVKDWCTERNVEHTWEILLPTAMQVIQEDDRLPHFKE